MAVSINFATSFTLIALLILVVVVYTLRIYRTTLPPIAPALRKALIVLRLVALALIFMLLFEPILGITVQRQEKPVLAVLLDDSASMQLPDSVRTRGDNLQRILQQPYWDEASARFDLFPVAFADTARLLRSLRDDTLRFNGDGTNLGGALHFVQDKLAGRHLSKILLLSDGINNLGGDPVTAAEQSSVPVYPVLFGKGSPEPDIWISEVITNEIAYANTEVPIEIRVRSTGFEGKKAVLQLQKANRTLTSRELSLPANQQEKRVHLSFSPDSQGVQKYTLRVLPQEGELTSRNNQRSLYLKILKSKLRIVLVAGAPSPEVAFLARALEADQNFKVEKHIALTADKMLGGALPGEGDLSTIDCIIAVDLLHRQAPTTRLVPWLRRAAVDKNIPLLFIAGQPRTANDIWQLRDLILLANMPLLTAETRCLVAPTQLGLIHPILRQATEEGELRREFENLPPVFCSLQAVNFLPGAQVLISVRRENEAKPGEGEQAPFLVAMRQGERRVLAAMGGGLWRWQLMRQRASQGDVFFEKFILNSIRWLASDEESKTLKVATDKDIYRTGENVMMNAQAYFEDFTPRQGLEITVQLHGQQPAYELILQDKGNGLYDGSLPILGGGDYTFTAVAKDGEAVVGRDQGKFTVESFQLEYLETLASRSTLEKMAFRSGGKLVQADSLSAWLADLPAVARQFAENRQFALWRETPILFLVIVLLAAEWYVRKRKGML